MAHSKVGRIVVQLIAASARSQHPEPDFSRHLEQQPDTRGEISLGLPVLSMTLDGSRVSDLPWTAQTRSSLGGSIFALSSRISRQ